ncbi:metallophosphoesterase [candidate division WOR-3 bacterium]|nr:metallophosphoesterase [candidate division WOR-3 bacterium]
MSLVGVISDTHDNLDRVRAAVRLFNGLGADLVVHCGDVVAQFVLVELSRLKPALTVVYGNCDGDRQALAARAAEFGFTIADGPYRFSLSGRQFVVSHQPVEPVPDCDYYLYGHTHRREHLPGRPQVVNPGEACGWLTGRGTAAVIDTDAGTVAFHDL